MGLDQDLYLISMEDLQNLIDIVMKHDTAFETTTDCSSASSDEETRENEKNSTLHVVAQIEDVLAQSAEHVQSWHKIFKIDICITNMCSFHNLYSQRGYGVYYGKSLKEAKTTIQLHGNFDNKEQEFEAKEGFMFVYTYDY